MDPLAPHLRTLKGALRVSQIRSKPATWNPKLLKANTETPSVSEGLGFRVLGPSGNPPQRHHSRILFVKVFAKLIEAKGGSLT